MKFILSFFCSLFFLFINVVSIGQDYKFMGDRKTQTMKFKMINNLIIIPIQVNGAELLFILDSGVGVPVIFNLKSSDSLNFKNVENIKLRGLGDGDSVDALRSKGNKIQIGNIYTLNQDLYIIHNEKLDLFAKLGITVNGIIGYDLLKDFVVTINYVSKKIKFTDTDTYVYNKCSKCEVFDLVFYRKKPYLNGEIVIGQPAQSKSVQLLIDSGSSDSLWLFENDENGILIPKNSYKDFIGEGISGSIYGMRSKIELFKLKSFEIKNSNVAYLDSVSTAYAKSLNTRSGSLGGGILKRFKVIFDYKNSKITLKKNQNYNDEFSYNMSGLELIHAGKMMVRELKTTTFKISDEENFSSQTNKISFDYSYEFSMKPIYKIGYVREGSPSQMAGLLVGDYLTMINGKSTFSLDLQEIVSKFYSKKEKNIKLTIERQGKKMKFEFKLKDLLGNQSL